jgi:FkbM family methyltransferase
MKEYLKKMVPKPAWNFLRTYYNRSRYNYLWQKRKVVNFTKFGTPIFLVIVDEKEPIQSVQSLGRFYEENELDDVAPYFRVGGTFVDIGANTGQHSIYFAKLLQAKAILFEPVPETCKILRENIRLNGLEDRCDLSLLGLGLSDRASRVSIAMNTASLGEASIYDSASGSLTAVSGDEALKDKRVDFVKIDVEGLEMRVLKGLTETIEKGRPTIYIEVDNANRTEFDLFLTEKKYEIVLRHKNYGQNENFLIVSRH